MLTLICTISLLSHTIPMQPVHQPDTAKIETTHTIAAVSTDTKIYAYDDLEVKPQPEIGIVGLHQKWSNHATYPAEAVKRKVEGKIIAIATIDQQGNATYSIAKGIDTACDDMTLSTLKALNLKWKPGMIKGKAVISTIEIPFVFDIDGKYTFPPKG